MILRRLQETIYSKCDMAEHVDPGNYSTVRNLRLVDKGVGCISSKRDQSLKRKVCRVRRWRPPSTGIVRINIDGSSHRNPGQEGIGGIGRGKDGEVIFLFTIYKGEYSNNLMEAIAIKLAIERRCSCDGGRLYASQILRLLWI